MKDQTSKDELDLFRKLHSFLKKYGLLYTIHVLMLWVDMQVKAEILEGEK